MADPTEFKNILLNCFCCSTCGFFIRNPAISPTVIAACSKDLVKNNNPTAADLKKSGQSIGQFLAAQSEKYYDEFLNVEEFVSREDEFLFDKEYRYNNLDRYNRLFPIYLTETQVSKLKQKKLTGSYSINGSQSSNYSTSSSTSYNYNYNL
jgi:hypothetical protein